MDQNELKEHEYQCGSKTKQCEYCGMNVPIMEYDLHLEYTCTIKQQFDNPKPNANIIPDQLPKSKSKSKSKSKNRKKNEKKNNNNNNNNTKNSKDLDDIQNFVFKETKKKKKRNKWLVSKAGENKDIIKYPDFNNQININNTNKQFNYMDKFAGDFVNNSDDINYLFFDDDVDKIPKENDKEESNMQKNNHNKDNKENDIHFNNDYEVINNIISNGNKNRKNNTKNKDDNQEKSKEKNKKKNQEKNKNKNKEKSKNKKNEDTKDKKRKKRKNSNSSIEFESDGNSSSSEDNAMKKREKIKSNDKKKKHNK